jgi:pimeloyl-ACP methyl ester carboxylesterase
MGVENMEWAAYHPFRSEQAREQYLAYYDRLAEQWPVPSESRMVATSYGQTFVRVSGAPQSPPLVLLPGGGAHSLMWLPNIAPLSAVFRTYALDNIYDYGRSFYTRLPRRIRDDLVHWLDELFAALGLQHPFYLIGGSQGGWLASQFALRFPERVAKLVLMAPAGTVLRVSLGFIFRALPCQLPYRYFKRQLFYWVFADLARSGEAGRRQVEQSIDELDLATRCFKPSPAFVNPTVLSDQDLRRLPQETFYLVGAHDKIYDAHQAVHRLNRVAPHIQTVIIPDAGHDYTVVQREMVNNALLEFLTCP